jgi:hypothetical protein
MEILQLILMAVGGVIFLVGGLWFLVESFREGIWWGLGCLLISPVQLVFLILHWGVAKKPFGIQLLGIAMMFVSAFLAEPGTAVSF